MPIIITSINNWKGTCMPFEVLIIIY